MRSDNCRLANSEMDSIKSRMAACVAREVFSVAVMRQVRLLSDLADKLQGRKASLP
jgi:hypothetical protein